MNPLAVTCECGIIGRGFSYCKACGAFLAMTLRSLWTVSKLKDGAHAGKWALVNPAGEVSAIYPRKAAAVKDCALRNEAA